MESQRKPFVDAALGRRVAPPPLWLMRQAGRWLPEYRALRARADNFVAFCLDPAMATEATLQPLARWPLDAAVVFSDILLLPWALGMNLSFRPGEGPRFDPPLEPTARALDALDWEGFLARLAPVEETLRRTRARLPGACALLGFCGAPWTTALYMLAGRGGDDARRHARALAWSHAAFMRDLLSRLAQAGGRWLAAQRAAGADAVQIFDSWSGEIPSARAEAWRDEPLRASVAALRAPAPDAPVIAFLRGVDARTAWKSAEAAKANVVSLDASADWRAMADAPPSLAVQGAMDPMALLAGGEALESAARASLEGAGARAHIFNLGHGVDPATPPEHGDKLVEIVKKFSR